MKRIIVAGLLTAAAVSGLTACAPSGPDIPTPVQTAIETTVVAPIVLNIDQLDGVSVDLSTGNSLNIVVPADQVTAWTGTSTDEAVASFVPGSAGDAVINPSVVANGPGTTTVTLVNAEKTVTFTINVN